MEFIILIAVLALIGWCVYAIWSFGSGLRQGLHSNHPRLRSTSHEDMTRHAKECAALAPPPSEKPRTFQEQYEQLKRQPSWIADDIKMTLKLWKRVREGIALPDDISNSSDAIKMDRALGMMDMTLSYDEWVKFQHGITIAFANVISMMEMRADWMERQRKEHLKEIMGEPYDFDAGGPPPSVEDAPKVHSFDKAEKMVNSFRETDQRWERIPEPIKKKLKRAAIGGAAGGAFGFVGGSVYDDTQEDEEASEEASEEVGGVLGSIFGD